MLLAVVLLSLLLATGESIISEDAEYVIDRDCIFDDVIAAKLQTLNKLKDEVKKALESINCTHRKDILNLYDYYMWQFKALEKPACKRNQNLDKYIEEFTECALHLKDVRNRYLPHYAYEFHTCVPPTLDLYKFV
uniref:Hypothetical secreted protein n=1 Tax=Simulium vittatum TaxID=7192 RepID=B5M0X0_SIMVI|nr:hypothetical secreted protein [Simulium vittatum]